MRANRPLPSLGQLAAIFIACAFLLAPMLAGVGQARAAAPDHHAQMMKSGECQPDGSGARQGSQGDDTDHATCGTCCTAMCNAAALAPSEVSSPAPGVAAKPVPTAPPGHLGHLAEIATPPPRTA